MSLSTRTLFTFAILSVTSVTTFSQTDNVATKKSSEKTDREESKTAGLRKITTQSQLRNGNFDVNIDEEAIEARIESAIERAMASVEMTLEKIEINIDPIEIDLSKLDGLRALESLGDIDIDPIHINIPDIDIDIEPIEIDMPDIDIDLDDTDIDDDFDRDDDNNEGDDDNEDSVRRDGLHKISDRDQDREKIKDKSEKDKSIKKEKEKSKEEKDKTKGLKKIN